MPREKSGPASLAQPGAGMPERNGLWPWHKLIRFPVRRVLNPGSQTRAGACGDSAVPDLGLGPAVARSWALVRSSALNSVTSPSPSFANKPALHPAGTADLPRSTALLRGRQGEKPFWTSARSPEGKRTDRSRESDVRVAARSNSKPFREVSFDNLMQMI